MAIKVNGLSGELRVGGRKAASLGRWTLDGQTGGSFIVDAALLEPDDYLMSLPSSRVLRLHLGDAVWVFRNVEVGGGGDRLTISGSGRPQIEVSS